MGALSVLASGEPMIRATIHQVLDKAWLEVEQHLELHGTYNWVSIGRLMLGDAEEIINARDGASAIKVALTILDEELKDTWKQLVLG